MVYAAQSQSYYGEPEQAFDPSKIAGLDAAVMSFRNTITGNNATSTASTGAGSFAATSAGKLTSSGVPAGFDSKAFAAQRDAKNPTSGGDNQPHEDRALAQEQVTNMAMGVDLDWNDKLNGLKVQVPVEDRMFAQSLGLSEKDMFENHKNGLAIDGGQKNESGLPLQVQRQIDAINGGLQESSVNYVDTESERAAEVDNGLQATGLGAIAATRATQMMMG